MGSRRPRRPGRAPSHEELTPDDEEFRYAHREIGRTYRGLRSLRGLFIVDAVLLGIIFAIMLGVGSVDVTTVIIGLLFGGAVLGALMVVEHPFPWCLTLAIAHTLLAGLMMLAPSVPSYIAIGLAGVLWWAVSVAANARKLIRMYPEAWTKHNRTYSGLDEEEIGSKYRDRARAQKRKRTQKILLFVGLPLVLLIVGLIVFSGGEESEQSAWTPKPIEKPTTPLAPQAAAFAVAWSSSDFDAVLPLISASERDHIGRLVRKVIRRRKWKDAHPAAAEAELEEYDAAHWYATHALEGYGTVKASWVWERGGWWIVRIKFKKES